MLCLPSEPKWYDGSTTTKRIILTPFKNMSNDKMYKHSTTTIGKNKHHVARGGAAMVFARKPIHTKMILFYKSHTGTWQSLKKGRAAYHRAIHFLSRSWVERGINLWRKGNFVCVGFERRIMLFHVIILSNNIF